MTPLAWVAVIPAAVIVLAAIEAPACAWFIGRLKRKARSYTDLVISRPEVPQQGHHWCDYGDCPECAPVPDTDRDWLSIPPLVFPADVTMEELEEYAAAIEHAVTEAKFVAIVCEHFPYDRDKFPA